MDIKSGQAETHETPLPLDTSATPGVAPQTPRFPSETGRDGSQGGVLADTSGVDFTADAAAAMHAGMAADADRRGRYATTMSPLGASYGDDMALPPTAPTALSSAVSTIRLAAVRQQIPRKAVELHPLPTMPALRAQGEARAVQRGPRTITEILQDARRAMELEDAYVAWLEGRPVPQLRHPRRTLRQWLTGRKPEPPPVPPPMTEIVPVWRSRP